MIYLLVPTMSPDPYGGPMIPDPSVPTRVALRGAFFEPGSSAENTAEGRPVMDKGTVASLRPLSAEVTEGDELEIDGDVWAVTGVLAVPRNPFTGWAPSSTIYVQRVK